MTLTEFRVYLTFFVWKDIYRIVCLHRIKHPFGNIEQLGHIIFLLQIQLLIALFVLGDKGVYKRYPYFMIISVQRILQQNTH